MAIDLSPGTWPKTEREQMERLESTIISPTEARVVEGEGGIISATVSPLSVYAGIQTLKGGGNAADAAVTTALTQVTMQLGSVVSYAGVFTMLYYDAKARQVYSMDAGYNSYLNETDAASIPTSDMAPMMVEAVPKPVEAGSKGRKTLVPGFMAGLESMHRRFGRLPFNSLFEPAIWYAEKGVRISPLLQYFFSARGKFFLRTPEGRDFLRQSGNEMPKAGSVFLQSALAKTLKAIRDEGSSYMYTGRWAENFINIIQREGGKVTAEDLKRYEPIWSEPRHEIVFGHTVYVNGAPHIGAHSLFVGLNLAETLNLHRQAPYWADTDTFQALARIGLIANVAPSIGKRTTDLLLAQGVDLSAESQLGKNYARALGPILEQIFTSPADDHPKHSNAIVVVDQDGNIAVVTHTINTVIWGDTGIVVDGVPIPDSAGFQQTALSKIEPGGRLPHRIIDAIAFKDDDPVLAIGSIGSSLVQESIRVLLGVLGQHQDLAALMRAPPLISNPDFSVIARPAWQTPVAIPADAYAANFVKKLKTSGLVLEEIPAVKAAGMRGTLAAVSINPVTGKRTAVDQPGIFVFNQTE